MVADLITLLEGKVQPDLRKGPLSRSQDGATYLGGRARRGPRTGGLGFFGSDSCSSAVGRVSAAMMARATGTPSASTRIEGSWISIVVRDVVRPRVQHHRVRAARHPDAAVAGGTVRVRYSATMFHGRSAIDDGTDSTTDSPTSTGTRGTTMSCIRAGVHSVRSSEHQRAGSMRVNVPPTASDTFGGSSSWPVNPSVRKCHGAADDRREGHGHHDDDRQCPAAELSENHVRGLPLLSVCGGRGGALVWGPGCG